MNVSQHRVKKQKRVLAIIESPCHLVQVGGQVLRADLVPCSHNSAFQEREGGFNGVGVNVPVNINPVPMADGFVLSALNASTNHGLWIGWKFVGHHNLDIGTDVFLNVFCKCAGLGIFRVEEPQFTPALSQTNHNFLIIVRRVPAFSPVLLSAYICFVHFYCAIQLGISRLLYSVTNAVRQIPSSPVVDSEPALELIRAHSLARLAENERSKEPLSKRQVRIAEEPARRNGELLAA